VLVAVAAACDGPPQTPGGTPSGCVATIAGEVVNYELASGTDSALLHFPADAEVHITGTVTNSTSNWLFPTLAWQVDPLLAASTLGKGKTATVDTTWTNGNTDQELTVRFEQLPGTAASDYEWDLHLSSTGNGCPPATPQTCAKAGGNIYYAEPTVVDGEQREGCYEDDSSCIADIPAELSNVQCDPNDIFTKSLAAAAGVGAVIAIDGDIIAAIGAGAATITVGDVIVVGVAALIAVGVVWILINGVPVPLTIGTTDSQTIATVDADAAVIDDVTNRMPTVATDNPGYTGEALAWAAKLAMYACVKDLALDSLIAFLGPFGAAVDPVTGMVGGAIPRHVCELIPTYEPGGSTAPGAKSMVSATLHIRDVLYGEHNGIDTEPTNPPTPQIQWQILTKAAHPDGDPDRDWHSDPPYNCTGSGETHCDEWPWFATKQGGPGAHLRIINGYENMNGGTDLFSFYSKCGVGDGGSFLVIPRSASEITRQERSFRFCPGHS
jgi:hypothetical protein